MTFFKQIDNLLMTLMTITRYPKSLKTPFSQFLYAVGFQLSAAALLLSPNIIYGRVDWFTCFIAALVLLPVFYHWRRWRQQEKEARAG